MGRGKGGERRREGGGEKEGMKGDVEEGKSKGIGNRGNGGEVKKNKKQGRERKIRQERKCEGT